MRSSKYCQLAIGGFLVANIFLADTLNAQPSNSYLTAAQQKILPPEIPWQGKSLEFIRPADHELATLVEKTDFSQTPDYTQTMQYLQKLQQKYPQYISLNLLPEKSDGGYAMYYLVISTSKDKSQQALKTNGKPIVYVEAGIHPGEPNGKDAGMMFVRDMLTGQQQDILAGLNLIFVPVVNVDGDHEYSQFTRLNQNKPEQTGWRENSRNLNLNRDFAKLDSAEIRNVVYLLDNYLPDFFMDIHSTNGINYQYDVTYCANGEGWSTESNKWIENSMTPAVFKELANYGHIPNLCISMNDEQDVSQGYYPYYSDLPRFSNQYADIRGIPAILVELHAIKPYKQQVVGNYVLYQAIFKRIIADYANLKQAIQQDRKQLETQKEVVLTWKESATPKIVNFKGVKAQEIDSAILGRKVKLWTNQPQDYLVPITPFDQHDLVVKRPKSYVIPVQWQEVISRLKAHGIKMQVLEQDTKLEVEINKLNNVELGTPFEPDSKVKGIPGYEGHLLVKAETKPYVTEIVYKAGSVVVPTQQPLGVLAMALLEPQSPDSFFSWGFFNSMLTGTNQGEIYIVEPMAQKMLAQSPELKREFTEKLNTDAQFSQDSDARLAWFYRKMPYAVSKVNIYPVGIVRK